MSRYRRSWVRISPRRPNLVKFIGSVLKRSYEGCLENILSCKGHGRSNRSTSAKDAQLQSYLDNIIDWKSMRCVVCPLLKVVQIHQMDMRLDFGSIVHRLGLLIVDQVRRVRLLLDPPFKTCLTHMTVRICLLFPQNGERLTRRYPKTNKLSASSDC